MATFQLDLVTPEHLLFTGQVRSIRAPGIEGALGVLAHHAPLMTALAIGLLKIEHENGDMEYIATSGGFMEVNPEKVVVLADTAERAADIDVARAEAAVSAARDHLNSGGSVDYEEATANLQRAMNRLQVANMQTER